MASLIIDTSSWIELAKPKFSNLLSELEAQVGNGLLEILMNEIIIDEWERNKGRISNSIMASIKHHAKSASKLSEFLEGEDAGRILSILEKYRAHEELQMKIANDHIERVEQLMHSGKTIANSDELKIDIANRALVKKAPFHNSKNNIADALIIFSAIQYVHNEKVIQNSLIFVSGNYKEFW